MEGSGAGYPRLEVPGIAAQGLVGRLARAIEKAQRRRDVAGAGTQAGQALQESGAGQRMRGDAGLIAPEGLADLQRPAVIGLGLGQPAVLRAAGGALGQNAGQLAAKRDGAAAGQARKDRLGFVEGAEGIRLRAEIRGQPG